MADKNNYLSRVTYKGGKDSYEFPFSYLRKDFVKAQIDVSEHESNTLAYLVDYTIEGHTIKLTKPVDADKTITIYRETSSTPLVEYEDSSILRAYDLNLSQRQNLNILEEQTDIVGKNYSFTQDTKDYMYKNLMDTKTAIDNKMSDTLDTVNASVSTMNDTLNTAMSSMDSKLSHASQELEDAKANLETTKSAVEKAMADTQSYLHDTESHVNETKADITKLADELKESYSYLQEEIKNVSTTNRNTAYKVGDQIHSSYLPFNCYITCVTAGTTGDTLPVIPKGDHDSGFTYTDGTATFKMDYWPLSINGKKPLNKAGDITINVDKVKEAEKADRATTATTADNSNKLGGYPLYPPYGAGGYYSVVPYITNAGVMEIGKYIDWHEKEGGEEDYSARWIANADGTVTVDSIRGRLLGEADYAHDTDKVDGYHASDLLSKMQGVLPKTEEGVGQFRELVVNDSHQVKLPDGGTWAYFVYTHNSWTPSSGSRTSQIRTKMGTGIAAGGTVLHTDSDINSSSISAFRLSGTAPAGGLDNDRISVGGFCWRIA